jgi:hypothetical protein
MNHSLIHATKLRAKCLRHDRVSPTAAFDLGVAGFGGGFFLTPH